MSLASQITALATVIGTAVKLRMLKSANLSDVANRQTALNNLTNAIAATGEQVLTKETATGNVTFKTSVVYEAVIIKGNTAQYFRGDMSLATMPTTLPASDVSAWAKAATKPSYSAAEVGSDAAGTARPASGGNADTVAGLAVATGRNSAANQIARTDASGYLQTGYINCSNGNENNNANADRVWGTNGSDDYLRTYRTSALSVGYAASAGSAPANGGNADSVDGQHFAWSNADNNPSYLWGANANGSAFLAARGAMSVLYASSAGSAPASDVSAWAKAATKPSYSAAEVGSDAAGTARPASDVYAWAKAAVKPAYTYAEIGETAPSGGTFSPSVISGNTTAVKNTLYVLTTSLVLTLPAGPAAGDSVKVSNLSGTLTGSIGRNGEKIMGLAENLTLDKTNAGFELMYTNATYGWVII